MRTHRIIGSLPTLLILLGQNAWALPGSHAPAISTFDTRASSVVLTYRHGSGNAGPFDTFSYNANFSSTTGKLSAQFGLHYVNFAPKASDATAYGAGGSGVALFEFPVASRYADGVPKAALAFYLGAVPTVYVSGQRNYLTLPFVFGFGLPLSPHKALTFTPWFEAAASANLDTVFRPADINVGPDAVTLTPNPATGSIDVRLNEGAVEAAVKKGVTIDYGFSVPLRAGLEAGIHLSESADFNLYTSIASLGGGFSGSSVLTLGAGLIFRWDDIVPAVLPAERRLERESCDAIETRFRACPNARQWLTPEQRSRTTTPAASPPVATKSTPELTPRPDVTPTPVTPAPSVAPTPPAAPAFPAPAAPLPTPENTTPPSAGFPN